VDIHPKEIQLKASILQRNVADNEKEENIRSDTNWCTRWIESCVIDCDYAETYWKIAKDSAEDCLVANGGGWQAREALKRTVFPAREKIDREENRNCDGE